jgi:hypothetical protein
MLVSMPKLRARDKAKNFPIRPALLVPELCVLTGNFFCLILKIIKNFNKNIKKN